MGYLALNQVTAGRRYATDSANASGAKGNSNNPSQATVSFGRTQSQIGTSTANSSSSAFLWTMLLNLFNSKPFDPLDPSNDPFGDYLSWVLMNRQMAVFNDYAQGTMPTALRGQIDQRNTTYTDDNNSVPLSDVNGNTIKYNSQIGNAFANIAEANAEDKNTKGLCLQGVREALEKAGLTNGGGGSLGESAYQSPEKLMSNPNFRANFTQTSVTTGNDIKGKSLRRGTVIVWQPSEGHPHGHITVIVGKDKNGRMMEASDHITEFKIREGVGCTVYEPSIK